MISALQEDLLATTVVEFQSRPGPVEKEVVLKAFHFILHDQAKLIEHSLEIIDQSDESIKPVQQYQHEQSGRKFWKVRGSRENEYLCLSRYCSCPSFVNLVKAAELDKVILCKHLLAIQLAKALRMEQVYFMSLDTFVLKMCQPTQQQQQQRHSEAGITRSSYTQHHGSGRYHSGMETSATSYSSRAPTFSRSS